MSRESFKLSMDSLVGKLMYGFNRISPLRALQTRKVILTLIQPFSSLDKGCNNVRKTFLVYRVKSPVHVVLLHPHSASFICFFLMVTGKTRDAETSTMFWTPFNFNATTDKGAVSLQTAVS